jgi:hypothetical protein
MKQYFLILFSFIALPIAAQDELDALLNAELSNNTEYAMGTFFSTRILNGQSVQMMPKGGLDFRVHHRFDNFNEGYNRFWGIDGSNSYLSLEYGFTDKLMLGFGRQNDAYFNGYAKYAILRQCKGAKNMPVSVVWVTTMAAFSKIIDNDDQRNKNFARRLNYTHQLLVARMFSPKLSFQITPTWVHRNMVLNKDYKNDLLGCGIGGRYKLTNTFSVNAEYYYIYGNKNLPSRNTTKYFDPMSVGVDIQISGHVFQIMVTNTKNMIEHSMLGETVGDVANGDIRLGFNISQVFTLGKKKK